MVATTVLPRLTIIGILAIFAVATLPTTGCAVLGAGAVAGVVLHGPPPPFGPTSHQNFRNLMDGQIGLGIDHPSISLNQYRQYRGKVETLSNGNQEFEYIWRREPTSCRVFFEVDKASKRIIAWRYEGTVDTCYHVA